MQPPGVVPALDVVEDGPAQPGAGWARAWRSMSSRLMVGEKALGDGVVPALPVRPEREHDADLLWASLAKSWLVY